MRIRLSKPKISVIMSVLDGEDYVFKSVNSILNQTFRDFEFLIVDDSSTDKTWEILRSIKDKRLRLFKNNQNMGLTKNLNLLIEKCRGIYIARIDADDVAWSKRLELQNKLLDEQKNCDLVSSFCRLINDKDQEIGHYSPGHSTVSLKWSLIFRNVIRHSTTIWKRSLGFYDENLKYSQDHDMWLKSKNPEIVKEILCDVRLHKNSITWIKNEEQKNCSIEATRKKIEHYVNKKVSKEDAKNTRLLCIHKGPKEIEEFISLKDEDFKNSVHLYMDIAQSFLINHSMSQTIIDEICWDMYGVIELRPEWKNRLAEELKLWMGKQDRPKSILEMICSRLI